MNPKFILPLSFALTAHVFLLFGLPGRTPVGVSAPEETPVPATDLPKLLVEDPVPAARGAGDPDPVDSPKGGVAPRIDDIPLNPQGPIVIDIPRLPGIRSDAGISQVSPTWVNDRGPGTDGTGPVPLIALDHMPRVRAQPAPAYPREMRDRAIEGDVVVEFLVDEGGNAYHAMIVSSSRREFEEPALRAVARWKFEPGFKNGRRVTFRMSVPLVFRLQRD